MTLGRFDKTPCASRALCLAVLFLASTLAVPLRAQAQQLAPSVADASRATRARQSSSPKNAKVFTNDDLAPTLAASPPAAPVTPPSNALENATSAPTACQNPAEAQGLQAALEAVQDERDQIERELSYQRPVISGDNLDLQNFHPGSSGLDLGAPPLSDSQPPAPARIAEVNLNQKIDSLRNALQVACDSPEAATIQKQLDAVEQQLNLAQRAFALDQNAYYSNPNYADDTAGRAKLDVEQQYIDSLQSERERLGNQLAAIQANPPSGT